MKKLLLFATIFLAIAGNAQDNIPKNENGNYEISEILEVPNVSAENIFNKSIQFLTTKYKFSQIAIQYQNLSEGKIIAKGEWLTEPSKWNGFIGHTIEIDVKENKYRIKIYNLTFRYFNNYVKKSEDINYPFETMPKFMGMRKNIFIDAENTLIKYKSEMKNYIISNSNENW